MNVIAISSDILVGADSVLLHEVQHAIQDIEGFAKGGSPQTVRTRADELKAEVSRLYEMMLETPEWGEWSRLIDRWLDHDDTSVEPRIEEITQSGALDAIRQEQERLRKKYGNDANVGKILNRPYAMDAEIWEHLPDWFFDKYEAYRSLGGEVESRNVQARMGFTPEQRRATLLSETEDVARADQIFLMANRGVSAMGTTVTNRKRDIAVKLQGVDVSPTQMKVVDAFTTDANNDIIEVVDDNGNQRSITLKQGQDNKAGVKHSVLRHYETASNFYNAEDILLIPQIIEQGERTQNGKKVSYKMNIGGVVYSVTTEINNRGAEVFTNFYTNRSDNARSSNTQLSAQADSVIASADKVSNNSVNTQEGLSDVLARPGDVFYSNAERAVLNIKQEKATPQQWLAMIEKQGGLKAGEDKWLGLSEWLKASDAKTLTKQEVLDYIAQNQIVIEEVRYGGERGINSTRMEYTTEGLENNKEIALVVPTVEPYNQSDEIHFGDAGGGRAVAWVRFGETTDAEGKRVLVIDEIQSKRHQDGREKGYQGKDIARRKARIAEIRERLREIVAGKKAIAEKIPAGLSLMQTVRYRRTMPEGAEYKRLRDEEIALREELDEITLSMSERNAVPDAPFEKNWHELAMKRMLRYAAENGFDKVAWTTGAQQAERYDIGRAVDSIESMPYKAPGSEDVEWWVVGINAGSSSMDLRVDANGTILQGGTAEMNLSGKQLSEVIGKELAKDILMSKEDTTFDGGDLRIGGEGMKGFYDKMLPSFMNKYGKKWGVKVGKVTMPNLQEGYQTMHSIDVTAEMRASVMEGQPLFRPGDSLAAVNERFNEELDGLTEENARGAIFDLGMPSEILTSCGIENKPIRLYGAKVVAKAKKHGYNPSDLRNLPMAINAPIAVFSGSQAGSYAILTEIEISGKKVLVSIMVGKGGHDVDFNIITSAYGKNPDSITRWINEGKLLYADKTKALDYLSVPAPIAGAQVNQELDDAAKIVENFENPTIGQENNAEIGGNVQAFADVAVSAGERLGVKVVVDPTMGSKGSYNLSTGEVRVNPNAHLTEADVERTVVHEVIGHGGMQALLGERFDEICANVYAHMSEERRADIRRRHGKGLSNAEVGAEYMAETAERMASGEQATSKLRQLWERIKGWIRDAARRRGIAVAMSDADIRYMIATASRKAREGKLQEMIDHAVETRRLRGAAMSQDAMESQLSQPLMRPRDSEDASQLASGVAGLTDAEYVQQSRLEEVARRVAGRWGGQNKKSRRERWRTNMIDASHPIHKVLQQMYGLERLDDVEKTLGYGERNAYMMRERAASRAADRVLVFRRQVLAPLNSMRTDFVKALAEEFGIKLSEALALSKVYFAAKTGLERQRVKEETAEDGAEDRDYAGLGGSMIWLGALLRHWDGAELPPIDWVAEAERRGYHDTLTKGWKKGSPAVAKLTENRAAVEEILAAHGYPTLEEWVDYVDGLSIEAAAAKGDIGMSRFGTADMWSIIQGVSRTMLEGQVKAGLLSAEGYQRLAFGDTFANILESRGVKLSSARKRELNGYTDSRQLVDNGYMREAVASKKTA